MHIDLDDFPHIDHRHPIDRLPMFADESVDLVYCCGAFQYFDRTEGTVALAEWHRILKPGAVLRLSVPDYAALNSLYAKEGRLDALLGSLFGRIEIRSPEGKATLYHRTVYDFASLERACLKAGFTGFRRYDWRQTLHKDYDDFSQAYTPHMDKQNGLLLSLNVEAVR